MSTKKPAEESKSVAVVGGAQLPDFMQQTVQDMAGLGNSTDPSDSSLPFLQIIQSGSPQIKEEHQKFIEGAKVSYLFNTATREVWPSRVTKGEDGIIVVPCGYQKKFVEWKPNRGGYADTHDFDIEAMKKLGVKKVRVVVEGKEREQLVLPSGNIITETAYTFVLDQNGLPMVIGAASTALSAMRDWMSYRKSLRVNGAMLPSFAKQYRLQTVLQQRDNNEWYAWKFSDVGFVTSKDLFEMAKEFATRVAAGEISVGRPDFFEEGSDEVPV